MKGHDIKFEVFGGQPGQIRLGGQILKYRHSELQVLYYEM